MVDVFSGPDGFDDTVSLHEVFFEKGLYEEIPLSACRDFRRLFDGAVSTAEVDGFCKDCEGETTFKVEQGTGYRYTDSKFWSQVDRYDIQLKCRRAEDHYAFFHFLVVNETVIKYGQLPSLASLQFAHHKQEFDQLNGVDRKELGTAVGLLSHGVGVGSFVYFRRILERIVRSVFEDHKDVLDVTTDDFEVMRFAEKMKVVADYLPDFLCGNAKIYSVLSKGIHELDEDTCLRHSEILMQAILIILEDWEALRQKRIRKEKAQKSLAKIEI